MKKINENTKITLTVGQLKKLVNESLDGAKPSKGSIGIDPTGAPVVVVATDTASEFIRKRDIHHMRPSDQENAEEVAGMVEDLLDQGVVSEDQLCVVVQDFRGRRHVYALNDMTVNRNWGNILAIASWFA